MHLNSDPADLPGKLVRIVGRRHLLTGEAHMRPYTQGYRYPGGGASAVALPGTLVELWRCLQAVVEAKGIVIMQAANTGLTGGSTPHVAGYDGRPVVIIGTRRLSGIHLLEGGRQIVALPGATLYDLEALLKPLGREPHSVIGSSCIGASVIGGICNSSGGALLRRGPAYTEYALYARLREDGQLCLVNDLGLELGDDAEEILGRLESGRFDDGPPAGNIRAASDTDYDRRVRKIDDPSPARYNADPGRLHGASGSAGRVAVFAVRLDTFRRDDRNRTFYVATNDAAVFTRLRRAVLGTFSHLPVSAEYLSRETILMSERYGRDSFFAIKYLGTRRLPRLFALKRGLDRAARWLGTGSEATGDRMLQRLGNLLPSPLPPTLRHYRDRYEHHLVIRVADDGIEEMRAYLEGVEREGETTGWRECTDAEAERAFLLRFVAAGAAIRYASLKDGAVGGLVALDVALPRNCTDWVEQLPDDIGSQLVARATYAHFFCHVFHRDYLVRPGCDVEAVKQRLLDRLAAQGAEYPAEHNVGHHYAAKPELASFYMTLDPCNSFNPGIGKTSRKAGWA